MATLSQVLPLTPDTAWLAPLNVLVERMCAGEEDMPLRETFAIKVSIPGDPDPQTAWERTQAADAA